MKFYLSLTSVFLLLMAFPKLRAQDRRKVEVDSLLKVIAETNEDTIKAKVYRTLTRMFAYSDHQRSDEYAQAAILHSRKAGDQNGVADGLANMFNVHFFAGVSTDSLLADLKRLESHVREMRDSVKMIKVYQKYALYYSRTGKADKELAYELKSLDLIRAHIRNPEAEAASLVNIGVSLNYMEQYEKALEYFYNVLALDIQNEHIEAKTHFQLGTVYFELHQLDSSEFFFKEALTYFKQENNLHEIIKVKISLGGIYDKLEQFKKAQQNYHTAYQLAKQNDVRILLQETYAGFASHYFARENYRLAVEFGEQYLEEMSRNRNYFVQSEYLEILQESYARLGRYKKAYEMRDTLASLRDSVMSAAHLQQMLELESRFQVQEQKNRNELLAAENLVARTQLYNIRIIAVALLAAFLLACGWGYTVFHARQREKEHNQVLEATVEERTKELRNSNRNIQQANYELRVFSYIASHDIKEPIRNISNYVGLIHRRLPTNMSESLNEYFAFIKNSTSQLYTLVEDFARYTSLSKDEKIELQRVDLQELTEAVVQSLGEQVVAAKGKVVYRELPIIQSNSSLLFSALKNLIENGLKFNESQRPVVKISYSKLSGHHQIVVSDNGVGIDSKYQDNAFEMFKRLHHKGHFGDEGSGIGLAIVKLVMEKLGGKVSVKSEVDQGSTFTLTLPENS